MFKVTFISFTNATFDFLVLLRQLTAFFMASSEADYWSRLGTGP